MGASGYALTSPSTCVALFVLRMQMGGSVAAVVVVYKGVGIGTYLHGQNLQSAGITAARPGQSNNLANLVRHIAQGSALSPFISFTKSWDVAEDYARNGGKFRPTSGNPAEVWEVHIPRPLPRGIEVIDGLCRCIAAEESLNVELSS